MDNPTTNQPARAPRVIILTDFPPIDVLPGKTFKEGEPRCKYSDPEWTHENLRQGHGPLGAAYPRSGWDHDAPGVWEGDTPSYLHLVSAVRGVNDPEKPNQGGWGGKFVRPDPRKNHWFDDPMGKSNCRLTHKSSLSVAS